MEGDNVRQKYELGKSDNGQIGGIARAYSVSLRKGIVYPPT